MNFCKWYNKTMLQLNKNFEKTNTINIFAGIIMILLSIILSFLEKVSLILFYPVNIIAPYIPKGLPFKRKSSISTQQSIHMFLLVLVLLAIIYLFILFYLNAISLIGRFIIAIILYCLLIVTIAFTVVIFNEQLAEKILMNMLADPIIIINNKLSSRCNLGDNNDITRKDKI